ncbi:DNAase [Virgibacillus halodenitrificans]|uniref:DNAase n=1 Tax=Virgibacillus halodenitrificans TaxID=1482 RepID=A0AAC9IVW3_VIRHA|nr:TatD family hydrolase [Virgibacillus halodenitrificans]APC47176.1 DNAase [Virgibacillus halodenitrificans]MCJ0931888.1 TatD family hydrolase [Virgibacillus halodenitrificans]CDQ36799.1 putative deoxyribonuclease YjjV [Virgibacillus halodenitrificans]
MKSIIDAHIHLDLYSAEERSSLLQGLDKTSTEALICVSNNYESAKKICKLAKQDRRIKPGVGYHPEQELPTDMEKEALFHYINKHHKKITAIGEVGLPYYTRKKNPEVSLTPYIELLEDFVKIAADLDKPIVLHAIYEDAPLVCDLLEKHRTQAAHFHWFKGDTKTVERMVSNGYYISITPDCLYEQEIRELVHTYPLEQMMVETDGPWPFKGPFQHQLTHPEMIHASIAEIAKLKGRDLGQVYDKLYANTVKFYRLLL